MDRTAGRPHSSSSLALASALALLAVLAVAGTAEARTRTFCDSIFNDGHTRACGGHLEPVCTSGSACNSGLNLYSGSPFPYTVNCPYPIPDEVVTGGCYDYRPTCADCGGQGQIPCPDAAASWCTPGCEGGLAPSPITSLCENPDTPGTPCGPGFPCGGGLTCDPLSFTCRADAQAGDSCVNPWIGCGDGLDCTLAFECSHEDGSLLGETCDVFHPCAPGLFCQPGIPQRCVAKRKVGEGCSAFNPCVDGASCEACLAGDCDAPLQCFPNNNAGAITQAQCTALYSPKRHQVAKDAGEVHTVGKGLQADRIESKTFEVGVAYGDDGSYGCYETTCDGINFDVGVEAFASFGFYDLFGEVGGLSWTEVEELQVPGSFVNFAVGTVYPRVSGQDLPPLGGPSVGWTQAWALGAGLSPLPYSRGVFQCTTTLDTLTAPPADEAPPIPPLPNVGPGSLAFDGVDDAVAVTDPTALAALEVTDALTVEAWIYPEEGPQGELQTLAFLNKEGEYEVGLLDGELAHALANGNPGWTWTRTGTVLPLYRWSHVAVSYDDFADSGREIRTYVDGQLVHRVTATGPIGDVHPAEEQLRIGGRQRGPDAFHGRIDEVRVWSTGRTAAEIRAGLAAPPDPAAPGLAAAWSFEESAGTLLADSGPGGLHLATDALGASRAPVRRAPGRTRKGGALSFDGVDDHVAVTDADALAGLRATDALTIEAWLYPLGPGSDGFVNMVVSKEGEYWLARAPDGRIYWALANASPGWVAVPTNAFVPEFAWTHVAFVYDAVAGEARVYLDGVLADARPASGPVGDRNTGLPQLRIGGRQSDDTVSDEHFHGVIDEVRVWTVARTAAQIADQHALAVGPTATGLAGSWRFDEGPVGVAFDAAAGNRHAVLGAGRGWESPRRVEGDGLPGYPASLLRSGGRRCGLGFEAVVVLPFLRWARRRLRAAPRT